MKFIKTNAAVIYCKYSLSKNKMNNRFKNTQVSPEMVVNLAPGLASLSPFAINNKFRLHSKYNTPIWIRCEAAVRGIYHLSSSSVPIIPDDVSSKYFFQKIYYYY